MRNTMADLNNHLFEAMERLNDDSLDPDALEMEIRRCDSMTKIATAIVSNGELALKAQKIMYDCGSEDKISIPLLGISRDEAKK